MQAFSEHLDAAQSLPFDGAVIDIESELDERGLSWTVFGSAPLDVSTLDQLVADYGGLEWGRYQHNFLRLTVHPADVDWFDDWSVIEENAQLWAELARELGFVGVMLDVEQYSDANLFEYPVQAQSQEYTFEQYSEQAYLRGRQYMDALESGYPDLTVMFTYALTVEPDVDFSNWESHHYGLLIPFVRGMLANADENATLIDGFENSYIYHNASEFEMAAARIHETGLQTGFGLWLDPYCGDGGLPDEGCGFSPDGFNDAVTYALDHGDGYVWVYSQRVNWYTGERIPSVWWDAVNGF